MRAVDSNVVIRLLVDDDARQVESAERYIASGAWVSILALAEAIWVLATAYHRSADQIRSSVERVLSLKNLTLQDEDVVAAALEHFKARPSLGFSDCLLLEIARKAGHLPLGTFDRNLSRLEGAERI